MLKTAAESWLLSEDFIQINTENLLKIIEQGIDWAIKRGDKSFYHITNGQKFNKRLFKKHLKSAGYKVKIGGFGFTAQDITIKWK